MLKFRKKVDIAVTACCEEPLVAKTVNREVILRCSGCQKYIGHVTARETALIESRYDHFMQAASSDRRDGHLEEGDLNEMFTAYLECVLHFAEQAARTTLRDFIERKRLNKC